MRLRGGAEVKLEEATESLTTTNAACSNLRVLRRDAFVIETLVRPLFMIVTSTFLEGRAEMPFPKQYHAVQALALRGLDEPLGERIQVGTPRREDHGRDSAVPQQASKGRGI